jgi:hypothetical protein
MIDFIQSAVPAILAPEAWPAWLGEEPADARAVATVGLALLTAYANNEERTPDIRYRWER